MAMSASSARWLCNAIGVYPGWLVVLAAFFGVMVSFGSLLVFTFGVFLKPLSAEFGWSRESISAAFGIAAMTVAVCSPVLGRLLDRMGRRPLILPCMMVFGLAFRLAVSADAPASCISIYAVFVVLGIVGNGTTQMGYSRAVSTLVHGEARHGAGAGHGGCRGRLHRVSCAGADDHRRLWLARAYLFLVSSSCCWVCR